MFLKAIAMNMTASERIISGRMFIVACGIKTDNHGDWEHVRGLNVVSTSSLPKVA